MTTVTRQPTFLPERAKDDPYRWRANQGLVLLLVGVVLLFALRQGIVVKGTGLGISPARLVFILCDIVMLGLFASGRVRFPPFAVLVSAQVVGMIFAFASANTRFLGPDTLHNPAVSLWDYGLAIMTSLYVIAVMRTVDDVLVLVRVLVAAGAFCGLVAIASAVLKVDLAEAISIPGTRVQPSVLLRDTLDRGGVARAQGTAGHPLELGATMSVLFPLAVTVVFQARSRRARIFFTVCAALIAGAALYSVSRTAVLACGIGMIGAMFFWSARRVWTAIAASAVAAVVIALASQKFVLALATATLTDSDADSGASRSRGESYVLSEFPHNPLFGQGLGTYVPPKQPILDDQYLGYLVETGLVGLLPVVAVSIVAAVLMIRLRRHPGLRTRDLAGGLLGSVLAIMVYRAVIDADAYVQITYLSAIVIGCAGALWSIAKPPADASTEMFPIVRSDPARRTRA